MGIDDIRDELRYVNYPSRNVVVDDPVGSIIRGFNSGLQTAGNIRTNWRDQDKYADEERQRAILGQSYNIEALPGVADLPDDRKAALMERWNATGKTLRDALELGKQLSTEREITTGLDVDRARAIKMAPYDIKTHQLYSLMPADMQKYADEQQEIYGRTKEGAMKVLEEAMKIPEYKQVISKATLSDSRMKAEDARKKYVLAQNDPNVDEETKKILNGQYKIALDEYNSLSSGLEVDNMREWVESVKNPRLKKELTDALKTNDVAFVKKAYEAEKSAINKERQIDLQGAWSSRHIREQRQGANKEKPISASQVNLLERQLTTAYFGDAKTQLGRAREEFMRRNGGKEPRITDIMTPDQINGYRRLLDMSIENFTKGANVAQSVQKAISDEYTSSHGPASSTVSASGAPARETPPGRTQEISGIPQFSSKEIKSIEVVNPDNFAGLGKMLRGPKGTVFIPDTDIQINGVTYKAGEKYFMQRSREAAAGIIGTESKELAGVTAAKSSLNRRRGY